MFLKFGPWEGTPSQDPIQEEDIDNKPLIIN